jgi:toxin secretion/phage lysis holin
LNLEIVFYAIQVILTVAGGYIGLYTKENIVFLYILAALVILDYITGIILATKDKKLASAVGAEGILKKVLIFFLIAVANLLDKWLMGAGSVLRTATIFFYLLTESVSFLDNLVHIGMPFPKRFKKVIEAFHHKA